MKRRDFLLSATMAGAFMKSSISSAADASSYFVPAEEMAHQCTFMQWPVSRQVYHDSGFLDATQQTIANIANAISDFEPVILLAAAEEHAKAKRLLTESVELWDVPTEDLWCRDSGPIFAVNDAGQLAVSHIQFNGWGEKQVHTRDARIAEIVAARLDLPLLSTGLKGEGGGVEQDGYGLLMANESSWVNDNRNPGMSRVQIENLLLKAYGADRMIWSAGVSGADVTDYHIDSLARFTGPGRVLINLPDAPDQGDPFHRAALETHDRLLDAGMSLDVIPEPNHRRVKSYDFVASYANYYACNGAVIAAEFGDRQTDQIARDALTRHYPGRDIVMLNVDALGELGGGIHCATQQMPAV